MIEDDELIWNVLFNHGNGVWALLLYIAFPPFKLLAHDQLLVQRFYFARAWFLGIGLY